MRTQVDRARVVGLPRWWQGCFHSKSRRAGLGCLGAVFVMGIWGLAILASFALPVVVIAALGRYMGWW